MKTLYKHIGGSRAYGLHTDQSDYDQRGVFCNTSIAQVLGLERFDHVSSKKDADVMMYELRHFFNLLRNGNTSALEILFAQNATETTPEFTHIQQNATKFINSQRVFKSLKGYIFGEIELAMGKRPGELGGKRRAQIEKYGYSPKNFVQIFRLTYCGVKLFTDGYFPVDIRKDHPKYASELLDIKLYPEKYTRDSLLRRVYDQEVVLDAAFQTRTYDYHFDNDFTNQIIKDIYLPFLQ